MNPQFLPLLCTVKKAILAFNSRLLAMEAENPFVHEGGRFAFRVTVVQLVPIVGWLGPQDPFAFSHVPVDLFTFELVEKKVLTVLFIWTRFVGPVDSTELDLSPEESFWVRMMDS